MSDINTNLSINADGTVDTGAALLKLDNLVTAYSAILEQATKQLESLELSDDQVTRITRDTVKSINYFVLAARVVQELKESNGQNSESREILNQIIFAVAAKVNEEWITPIIERIVDTQINSLKSSLSNSLDDRIDAAVERRINSVDSQARRCNTDMRDALSHLLGKEIKNAVTNEVAPWRTSVEELIKKAETTTTEA